MNRSFINIINVFGNALAGVIGGAAFLVFFLLLKDVSLLLAIGAGLVTGIGGYLAAVFMLPGPKPKDAASAAEENLKAIIEGSYSKVKELRQLGRSVAKPSVKSDVEVLCITFEDILENYKKDPADISAFLGYYLDSSSRIVKKYIELSKIKAYTPEVDGLLKKSEDMISSLKAALSKQMESDLKDEMIDLEAEISTLEKTIKTEGLK